MLPPGHLAGGLLAAQAALAVWSPELSPGPAKSLVWWGVFFSFAPDLDNFAAFGKVRAWWYKPGVDNTIHRRFPSHAPLLWLAAAAIIFIFAPGPFWQGFALMVLVGSWSHFLLDSIEFGVPWLWPWKSQVLAIRDSGVKRPIIASGFFDYWLSFLKYYSTRWTCYVEVFLLVAAVVYLI